MTNPLYGASLFQPRKTDNVHQHLHSHSHSHLHSRKSAVAHARSHADFHNRRDDTTTADLDSRGTAVTEVVQTISVVQIIDATGATLSAQTLRGASHTDVVDSETGSTIDANINVATTSTDAVSAVTSVDPVSATETATSASASLSSDPSATETSVPDALSLTHISTASLPAFSTLSSTSNSTTITSSSSISSLLSSISASVNSTSTSSTDSDATFTSSQSSFASSISSSFASTTFASSSLSSTSTSISSSITSSTTFSRSSSTGWLSPSDSASLGSGGTGSGATTTDAGTSSTSAASGSASDDATAQSTKVAGGIVGGIAGLALLVGLAFMLLRLRKRGWCHLRLGAGADEPDAAARQALPAPGGGGGDGGTGAAATSAYGTMQQPRSAPQAITASLAALAGGRRTSRERAGTGSEMAERGFVRVSGKKLPPVLQFGGDGYSDPRENRASHMTDASVYRDSIAVFDQPHHRPLALGSPMRPESGIMTMHAGPARTPVTSRAPSSIDSPTLPRSNTFPAATDALGRTLESEAFSRETIGRTLAATDQTREGTASRGSHHSRGSTRFTEHVT